MIANPRDNPPTLEGTHLIVRPTVANDALEFLKVAPLETFEYFVSSVPSAATPEGFEPFLRYMLETPSVLSFTIIEKSSGAVVGSSSYLDIRPEDDHVEVGLTWYTPASRGTFVNPEAKLLLLTYAFETLSCIRVTLKCDERNERSKAAILKLGAKYEGTLRKHRTMHSGFVRDTTYFSILADEWPAVKAGLESRIQQYGSV